MRAPVAARTVANGASAVGKIVQLPVGKVEIGALDHFSGKPLSAIGYTGSGEVLVGSLDSGTARHGQLGPVGTIGLSDVFTPSRPGQNQAVPLSQNAGDEAARLLWAPTPTYNEEARRLKVTGEVVLQVKMTASGEVRVLRILSGLGHGLDQAAVGAVNQTRCRPALKAGRPVDVIATIRVIFKLA
ncbi:MAG: energy transducer TonB [Acidobacteriia bacterium]|nr:energy transducer TonB [Terriglobia bacterium]